MTLTEDQLQDFAALVSDPIKRLHLIYEIKAAKGGKLIPFDPTPEQDEIIDAVHVRGERAILILKARQLGMSTCIDLIIADLAIWNEGFQAAIVDQTKNDATLKLRGKVKVAFESMPAWIRECFEVVKDNDSEFSVRLRGDVANQVSSIFAGTNARGGTNQALHVSEWGPIQHDDPERSEEIMTGALPSAKEGIVFVETTWKGGKGGHLWEITKRAMELLQQPENLTDADFRLYFFPWWREPTYTLEGNFEQVPETLWAYFAEMERQPELKGHKFTKGQVLWYFKVAMPKNAARFAEFPTILAECFKAPVPGAVYAHLVDQARASGQIKRVPYNKKFPVHTAWDLGSPKNTRVLYFQLVGHAIHFIDYDSGLDFSPQERAGHMRDKGYVYGLHLFPHDAKAEEKSGKSFEEQMGEAGLKNITIIPRCLEIWTGINGVGEMWNRIEIDAERCEPLLVGLEAYHTRIDRSTGHETSVIVHDWSSHDADTVRMVFEAMDAGLIKDGVQPPPPKVISPIPGLGDEWEGGKRQWSDTSLAHYNEW